jgi:hypothetical protein
MWTGPTGNYGIGAQGSVGDLSWPLGGGLQDGHYKNDFNMDFPDVLPPYQTGLPPAGNTVGTTNYTWYLGNNNYMCTDKNGVTLQNGDQVYVAGRATVYVTDNFIMQGGASITIAPGASLHLYVAGKSTQITTVNNGGNCAAFSYYGLPGNTSINLSGRDILLGTIYAPNAALTLSGSGDPKIPIDYQGACAVNTIKLNGHFNFHFDENLRRAGPMRGYQLTSWTEI